MDWQALEALTDPNRWLDGRIGELATVAQNVQSDLEEVALSLCRALRHHTGANNLALAGGVALNSVLNGRIRREAGFAQVHVPSAPGDEGVALGCALYGLHVSFYQPLPPFVKSKFFIYHFYLYNLLFIYITSAIS